MNLTTETKILIGTGLATLIILVGGIFFLTKNDQKVIDRSSKPADASVLVRSDSNKISTDSAKVTLVEFGDYQCPACAGAYPIVKKVLSDYDGKVNFVFRNFPLPQHANALIAAEAAEVAGEQGKYWEMHDKLYQNRDDWGESGDAFNKIVGYATDLKLDIDSFKKDVQANKFADKIQRDVVDGNTLGVSVTPTFYINGLKMDSYSYEKFKSLIDANSR